MQNFCHGRTDNIALTFTPRVLSQVEALPALFGPGPDASLESSVLGSILPGLDPCPPKPHAFPTSCSPTSLAPRLGEGSPTSPRSPVNDDERHGPTRCGVEANWVDRQPRCAGAGPTSESMLRTVTQGFNGRRHVRHGLRVLLRGAPRCGKTTILFDYCHRAAMVGCRVVLVLFKLGEEDPENLPSSMRSGMRPGDELRGWEAPALARIGIKYVRSHDDLAWYLASLHNLPRDEWPTVIAGEERPVIRTALFSGRVFRLLFFIQNVDDLDKIVNTSASGLAGGMAGTNPGGGASAGTGTTLRILALLQDTAEFFDNARAGALESSETAAATAAGTLPGSGDKRNPHTEFSSPKVPEVPGSKQDTRGVVQATVGRGAPGSWRDDNDSTRGISLEGMRTFGQDPQDRCGGSIVGHGDVEPVRVIGTCATSDQDLLWVYRRFMHVMARVQNTTGPDCFVLRVDVGASAAAQHPRAPPRPVPTLHGGGSDAERSVAFVRSRLDGSFSLF